MGNDSCHLFSPPGCLELPCKSEQLQVMSGDRAILRLGTI